MLTNNASGEGGLWGVSVVLSWPKLGGGQIIQFSNLVSHSVTSVICRPVTWPSHGLNLQQIYQSIMTTIVCFFCEDLHHHVLKTLKLESG